MYKKQIRYRQHFLYSFQLSQKPYLIENIQITAQPFHPVAFGTVTDQKQFCRDDFFHFVKNLDYILHPLYLSEIRSVHQQLLTHRTDCQLEMFLLLPLEAVHIDKIWNDFNFGGNIKM